MVLFNVYFERERERESEYTCTHGGGVEKRRERIPSRLCAVSIEPNAGLSPVNQEIMT